MNQKDIDLILQQINKKSPDNNIWFTSIAMTNSYLSKFFDGTEHDLLKTMYAKYLFIYILEFLNGTKNLANGKFTPYVIRKFINDIRKHTYGFRKKVLFDWINCVGVQKDNENNLTQCLVKFYPSMYQIKEVKQQLGLNYVIN